MKQQGHTGLTAPHSVGNIVPKPSTIDVSFFATFRRNKTKRKAAKTAKRTRKMNRS
jgi:hypothetical protein